MTRPKLLDLYCGAGGASEGYRRAGFDVTGVDIKPQPRYKSGRFIQADALEYAAEHYREYQAITGSPPCFAHTKLKFIWNREYKDYIAATRTLFKASALPFALENVDTAPLENAITLCGSMFGLRVRRHRLFETSPAIYFAPATCNHSEKAFGVYGHFTNLELGKAAMGIDWMSKAELVLAIPPAYTEYIGKELLKVIL